MSRPLVHVFDLGNVLLFVHEHLFFERIQARTRPGAPLVELFFESFDRNAVDTGGDFEHVYRTLCEQEELDMSRDDFLLAWNDMFTPNPPMIEFVRELPGPRILLSNTNEPHVAWFREHYPYVLELFDHCVFSNEVGIRKPELGIYRHVESLTLQPAAGHVFTDDIEENVDGAVAAGWRAIQFHDIEDYQERLAALRNEDS